MEIQTHGSPGVVRGILDLALAAGARMALPGRVLLPGLPERQDVGHGGGGHQRLGGGPDRGPGACVWARGSQGGLEGRLRIHLDSVMDLRAEWEAAGSTFPEDMEGEARQASRDTLAELERHLSVLTGEMLAPAPSLRYLREGWRVALVGPANSGKSSLFNALLGGSGPSSPPTPGPPGTSWRNRSRSAATLWCSWIRRASGGHGPRGGPGRGARAPHGRLRPMGSCWSSMGPGVGRRRLRPSSSSCSMPPSRSWPTRRTWGRFAARSPEGTLAVSALTGQAGSGPPASWRGWMESSMPSST